MLIKRDILDAIKAGRIDLQFRRWTRPTVKAGGTLKTAVGVLRIGRVDDMRPEDVTAADARRAGFADLAAFNRWLSTMKQGLRFQRIEISWDGEGRRVDGSDASSVRSYRPKPPADEE